jgi:hypothetical protein
MVYEYMRVTQVHSLNRFPPRWCYPLSLLLHYLPEVALPPQFCANFHQATPCYSELLRGKEYSTELPIPSDSKLQSVWQDDEVSPASFLTSHKQSNLVLLWTPHLVTRVLPVVSSETVDLEVTVAQDESVVHVKDQGRFLSHYATNGAVLRSFTCDTVPFTVVDSRDKEAPRVAMQEILAKAYLMLNHKYEPSADYNVKEEAAAVVVTPSAEVFKEVEVEGLAKFTAYRNKAVKVAFEDRTIVRLGLGSIRVLTRLGEELVFIPGTRNSLI